MISRGSGRMIKAGDFMLLRVGLKEIKLFDLLCSEWEILND